MGSGLEAMRRESSSFYHYNHLGTTLALTGADEAVSDTYRHDAWGVLLASAGSTPITRRTDFTQAVRRCTSSQS